MIKYMPEHKKNNGSKSTKTMEDANEFILLLLDIVLQAGNGGFSLGIINLSRTQNFPKS